MLSDDRQLVERDASIPGLSRLLDFASDDRLLALLQWQHATTIRCQYLRYKPQSSCLAGLVATIDGTQHYATVTAIADTQADKLAKFYQASGDDCVYVERNTLLALGKFPFDRRMPALKRLIAGDQRMLDRLLPAGVGAGEVQLRHLRYKPERRYVAQLDYCGAPLGTVKLYSPTAYRNARRVVKTLGDTSQVGESRAIGHIDRHAAISFHWRAGEQATIGAWPTIAKPAAHELAHLHSLRTSKLPKCTQSQFLHRLRDAGDFATWLVPEAFALVRSVQSALASRLSESAWHERVLHGDLHLGQMLLDDNQLALIDFDRASLGPAEWDLANLSVDLHRRTGASPGGFHCGHMLSQFLSNYERLASAIDGRLLATLTALRLFETSLEPFRNRDPNWKAALEDYLQTAGQVLTAVRPNARGGERVVASHDDRLPWLSSACNSSDATRRFATLPGKYVVHHAHLVRHKPGRRALIEYHVLDPSKGTQRVLLGKTEHKPRHQRRLQLQQQLWHAGFDDASADGIAVARPVGIIPEWNMWLQEYVVGMGGWKALSSPRAIEYACLAARALAKLHRSHIKVPKTHTFANERELLVERLAEARRWAPCLSERIKRLQYECLSLCDSQQDSEYVVLHRDFYPDQLLFTERGAILLDLDLVCLGPASIDVGNFAGHLLEMGIRQHKDPFHFSGLEHAFIEAYVDESQNDIRASVNQSRVLTLARHVYISSDRKERRDSTEDILTYCEELVAKEHSRLT